LKQNANYLIIVILTFLTFWWTFTIFHIDFNIDVVLSVILVRVLSSRFILKDYSLQWSKATPKSMLIKTVVYFTAFAIYMPFFYTKFHIYFMASELFLYLFTINFLMFLYSYYVNRSSIEKTKKVVIYGTSNSAIKLYEEFHNSQYSVEYFVDNKSANRSLDSIEIISENMLKAKLVSNNYDLLVITQDVDIKKIYDDFGKDFKSIKILPSLDDILNQKELKKQLKNISVEDLLARNPKDLDKDLIKKFIENKTILISGAGGSIGSELALLCESFNAKELLLLDNSEFNLYSIDSKIKDVKKVTLMQSITDKELLKSSFKKYKPDIVIHAAAYKHVPLVEDNIQEAFINNIIGTKNIIDLSIEFGVSKFIFISSDKAVRPTNVMGATKRVGELYAQNIDSKNTEIVSVRFGNVLGSSGSVIPKFKEQIENGQNITVTHPDVTRYFMLVNEACELVLQAGAIGEGKEIFILDMGEPIKIVDLAKKMIELSGRDDIKIEFSGLRKGEKLFEELLINESDAKTKYESITVAKPVYYDIVKLNKDIDELLNTDSKLEKLKEIVPEFNHQTNGH